MSMPSVSSYHSYHLDQTQQDGDDYSKYSFYDCNSRSCDDDNECDNEDCLHVRHVALPVGLGG